MINITWEGGPGGGVSWTHICDYVIYVGPLISGGRLVEGSEPG